MPATVCVRAHDGDIIDGLVEHRQGTRLMLTINIGNHETTIMGDYDDPRMVELRSAFTHQIPVSFDGADWFIVVSSLIDPPTNRVVLHRWEGPTHDGIMISLLGKQMRRAEYVPLYSPGYAPIDPFLFVLARDVSDQPSRDRRGGTYPLQLPVQ